MTPFSYGELQLLISCMILQPTNPPWKSKTQGSVPWWLEGQPSSVEHLALITLQSLSQVCACGTVWNFRYCNMPVREILNCLEMRCWDSDIKQVTSFSQQVFWPLVHMHTLECDRAACSRNRRPQNRAAGTATSRTGLVRPISHWPWPTESWREGLPQHSELLSLEYILCNVSGDI